MKGFKAFILRGNVLDLAVAFVIGVAFAAVVTALVDGIINPIIGALFDANSLNDSMDVVVGSATIKFGVLIAALINFLLIALVVYFGLVVPVNHLKKIAMKEKPSEEEPPTELALLADIRDLLARTPVVSDGKHVPPVQ